MTISEIPICCSTTSDAEYIDRVGKWKEQFVGYNLHTFSDGYIDNWPHKEVILHSHEKYGRKSCWNFPGWKASFALCCDTFPNGFLWIESDVIVQSTESIKKALENKNGLYSGYSERYGFMEPSVSLWTDSEKIKAAGEHMRKTMKANECAETYFDRLKPSTIFKTIRQEHVQGPFPNYDFICQAYST